MPTCKQHPLLCFQIFERIFSLTSSFNLFEYKKQEAGDWLLAWGFVWFLDLRWPFENNREQQHPYLRGYIAVAEGKMPHTTAERCLLFIL